MARHIKKGDTVEVISGAQKGTMGKVMRVITSKGRVIVEGINRRYKHVKPSRKYPQGGRVQVERSLQKDKEEFDQSFLPSQSASGSLSFSGIFLEE